MAKTLDILDCTGSKVGEYEVKDSVIELEKGAQAVHDSVVAFLAGQRAGTACTKNRSEVRGGGAKPFRQKGRGAARAGSSRNPVWTGGGVAFGPKPRSFAKKVNKKVLVLALKRALSERIEEGSVIVLDKFAIADHKTKSAMAVLKAIGVASDTILLGVPEFEEAAVCATGNIPNLVMRTAATINVYELLRFGKLVFTKDALDGFIGRLE
ncbi:MAG: 50S ribosomal protein L4 [Victivallaceae bacterium]|nr:50S ribosomal protein L4 [Victivallaceae bacterium]